MQWKSYSLKSDGRGKNAGNIADLPVENSKTLLHSNVNQTNDATPNTYKTIRNNFICFAKISENLKRKS